MILFGCFLGNHYSKYNKNGCPKCAFNYSEKNLLSKFKQKLTTEEIKKRIIEVHGDKYDLSKLVYLGAHKKIELICIIHRFVFDTPRSMHKNGSRV